ncbi:MAG: excinuclease ABC subunit UvrC [Tyzzerella sp.]|uniref:UvrABC system protein C n=1 Tax=Candidatus Fimicola merdigallinarum TaxID=2840819 RepID=A0A9D9DZ59_9FIRM|nr:excinuclease ABC subunit UvrC [Candidatus Fimicola merdigallinarum]
MFDIEEELKKLPEKPGVYIMKDENDAIIYVGKAKILKNRVRQYFRNTKNQPPKVKAMVKHIKEFEYIVTDSEMEALILECNLIKLHKPHYNIMLKDDKMYPYIKITVNEDFPRIFVTRNYVRDNAKYIGPITDALAVKEMIETIHKLFPIRKCKKVFPRDIGKERPCLNYHIGQCKAPCDGLISKEEYRKYIDEAILLIEGKHEEIAKKMRLEMEEASENLEFEKAMAIRDKLKSIKSIAEKQKMANTGLGDCDVIAFARAYNEGIVQVFFIRGGKMTGREHFLLDNVDGIERGEVITDFVKQFYSGTAFVPKEIIVQDDIVSEEKEIIEGFLSDIKGSKVTITAPQKGEKKKLVDLASKNAIIVFEQTGERLKREEKRTVGAVSQIQKALGIDKEIVRIEAYDISNTQGFDSVGSMVVFEKGKAKRSDYRKFKIKTVIGANDFASMEEVLTRRFKRGLSSEDNGSFSKMPDLIMMDGGKIQVNAGKSILEKFGLDIPICGMIKDDRHRTRGLIYNDEEIYMPLSSEGFLLVTRIQDEVHRFAIEYHRKLREKNALHSVLDDIKGVGEKRRKALMKHFGSVENISKAEVSDLLEVEGMNIKVAESVYAFFRGIKV